MIHQADHNRQGKPLHMSVLLAIGIIHQADQNRQGKTIIVGLKLIILGPKLEAGFGLPGSK